jgi:hypothetical protein
VTVDSDDSRRVGGDVRTRQHDCCPPSFQINPAGQDTRTVLSAPLTL